MDSILEENPNQAIKVRVHYDRYVFTDTLVFDVRKVGGPDIGPTVLSSFFELASKMRGHEFETVKLAWKGRTFLLFDGQAFKRVGSEFGHEEPYKIMTEMAGSVKLPNGKPIRSLDRRVLARLIQMLSLIHI